MKIAFFDAKPYDIPAFARHGKENGIAFKFYDTKLSEDTVALAQGTDGVCVFVNYTVNAAVIDRLASSGARFVALRCAGYNNVDLAGAAGKVRVVRVPAYSPYAVAEHAMALLLTSIRRIHKAYIRTKDFNFSLNGLTGFDLHGKTVGVVGTGRIGRVFIDICRGFGMRVIAYDKFPVKDAGIDYVPLDELFRESDVISFHCPLTE
ncbi:MAG: 2-hydroxyacid dehydrogenase, partial [Clostridia bacterium]|nr:2-hydroxyacid dehydrogenase [Clostridia bacterium]